MGEEVEIGTKRPAEDGTCEDGRCQKIRKTYSDDDHSVGSSVWIENIEDGESSSSEVPQYLLDGVLNAYKVVNARYNKMLDTEGLALYLTLDSEPRKQYAVKLNTPQKLCTLTRKLTTLTLQPEEPQPKNQTLRNYSNGVIQKCPVRVLEHCAKTPRMQYWTLTEFNILKEDERTLSHIPFLGDSKDDSSFYNDLLETFSEGIHGTREGCRCRINDHILYYMLKKLFETYPSIDEREIFAAVYEQFPNKVSVQQLPTLYLDLQNRFEPSSSEKTGQNGCVDTKALHSFILLMCNRCLNYDCFIHGVESEETGSHQRPGHLSGIPCGPFCFMHSTEEMEETTRTSAVPPDVETVNAILQIKTDDTAWTPQQESLFIALQNTYKNDFCKLAQVINMIEKDAPPKTCRELYAYSFRTGPISPRANMSTDSLPKKRKNLKDQHRLFRAVKWSKTEGKVRNTHSYLPCSHDGPCSKENKCRCIDVDNLCTKFCDCDETCKYRFPGCRCGPGLCHTKQCQCFFANWECDPDLCKSCGSDSFDEARMCRNVKMQRGMQKKLLIAPSEVAGWGCFAGEDIEKHDFISEYCGELITHDESERRGKIYDKISCSYLFGLNDEYTVDATRKGNVIRFANHSNDPNCYAKVLLVNGDHRIGIFARRNITKGEELFFDYSYNSHHQVKFVSKERPRP